MDKKNCSKSKINVFQLAMITVAYVASIRTSALMAQYGLSSLSYYFLGAVLFLIPTALISAELSTMFPSKGGIYTWVSKAVSGPYGFISIWIQFMSNLLCMPIFMIFLASSSAYIFGSLLAENKYYVFVFIFAIVWLNTLMALRGIRTSGRLTLLGNILGILIPIAVLITFVFLWIISGNPINTPISVRALFPNLSSIKNLVFLAGLILSFGGIETSGAHILDMEQPRNYYKSILIATAIIPTVSICSFAISIIIPRGEIGIVTGVMEAFEAILKNFNLHFLVPLIAFIFVSGMAIMSNSGIIGPSKGLLGSSKGGELPPFFHKQNKNGVPVNLLMIQAILITAISSLVLFIPDINSAYLLILDAATCIYMTMYIMMFVSVIILRYKYPNLPRPFKVPGGTIGIWIIAGIGTFSALTAIVLSFIPPSGVNIGDAIKYKFVTIICEAVLIGVGLLIYALRKPEWINQNVE